jgi:hypothetical protein
MAAVWNPIARQPFVQRVGYLNSKSALFESPSAVCKACPVFPIRTWSKVHPDGSWMDVQEISIEGGTQGDPWIARTVQWISWIVDQHSTMFGNEYLHQFLTDSHDFDIII